MILPAFALLWLIVPAGSARPEALPEQGWVLVDGIAAAIDGVPVLRSDIAMEADFGLLTGPDGAGAFSELLDLYLNRILILRELEDVGGFRLEDRQVEEAFEAYLRNLGGTEVFDRKLKGWSVGEEEIVGRFRQGLLASLYAEDRIRFLVKVLPSDVEKAYAENPEKWGNRSVFEAWESIREELVQESFSQEKERWIKSLRNRYSLEVFPPAEGEAP